MKKTSISVIIPVFNAKKYLKELFKALDKNYFLSGDEILLVDNGSSDESIQICREKAKEKPDLYKVISYTEKAGSYATRNYAIDRARGDILVFTDSDTKPVEDWINEIRSSVRKGVVIAGRIQLDIVHNSLWEKFDTIAHLNSEENAKYNQIATANMAVFREDFLKVGLFEERFSGGDYEWSQRAGNNGLKIEFNSKAIVHHPTRKTFEQILMKERRIAYGAGNHYKNEGHKFIRLVIRYVLKIIKFDTNIRYIKELKKRGCTCKELIIFNNKFMIIRFQQLLYAIKGYRLVNARNIGIK